jgi:acyl carrier protein
MNTDQIRARVAEILSENFDITADKVTDEATFRRTLGLDSLDVVDFVWFLHDTFGYKAELAEYREIETVGDLVVFIQKRATA